LVSIRTPSSTRTRTRCPTRVSSPPTDVFDCSAPTVDLRAPSSKTFDVFFSRRTRRGNLPSTPDFCGHRQLLNRRSYDPFWGVFWNDNMSPKCNGAIFESIRRDFFSKSICGFVYRRISNFFSRLCSSLRDESKDMFEMTFRPLFQFCAVTAP
jgi:hypothetical protein